ncbi:uncharacterized protein LOC123538569 [Mercenaria mercenaria]|uniref:uncharacterized protein LOC123538569 n=1 Tax=Mercenaria mercenaria TaxID=6596 RepID=UPI00234E851C|nr:uncharacterized protein LOC123538569 [Mercenaria mercenaria]
MESKDCAKLVLCLLVCGVVPSVLSAPMADNEESLSQDLNGDALQEMGTDYDKPLLQLIGKAIEQLESKINDKICDLHPCSEWEEWTGCFAHVNDFGAKFRTRECGVNYKACDSDTKAKTEETEICHGYCPDDYNITNSGYCVKLYRGMQTTREEAERQCESDGGHLVNIDCMRKYKDVKGVIDKEWFTSQFWVDGLRSNDSSTWEYGYGSAEGFFNWYPGEPSNGEGESCLVVKGYQMQWQDVHCLDVYNYMCEVIEL